jgi:antitoxin CptB
MAICTSLPPSRQARQRPPADLHWNDVLDRDTRLKRLKFRAWHRGTREADMLVGGFFDRHAASWTDDQLAWFESLMNEQDVDIIGWAMGSIAVPEAWDGPMMQVLKKLDYIEVPQ